MYNVSADYKNYIKLASRKLSSRLVIGSKTYTDTDIVEMTLEGNLVPGEEFTLGTTVCNKLEVTIITNNNVVSLSVIRPYVGLDINGTIEEVPLGVFNIDDVTVNKGNKKIVAYDNMMKLEKAYFSNLSYPATIQAIATEICQKAGVSFSSTLPNYSMNKIEGKTLREAIGIIAGICGGFASINRTGSLEIKGLTTTDVSITGDNFFGSIEKADKNFTIKKITAIKEDNSTISSGGGLSSEEITFSNNYLNQVQLNSILTTYNNYSYMPLKFNWQGNPAIDVGDKIKITDIDNTVYSIPVMRLKLSYKGGLKSEITSVAKGDSKSEYAYKGTVSKKVEAIVTEQINVRNILANTATIEDLYSVNARIDNLTVDFATIDDLNAVNTKIDNLKVTTAMIENGSITTAKIANGAITSALIENGAIKTAQIEDGSITDAKIVELTANKITAGILSVERLEIRGSENSIVYELNNITGALQSKNVDTLNGEILTPRTITADKIVAKSITANEIAANTITANQIAANTITAESGIIANAAIVTVMIADASITNAKIVNISADKITTGYLSANRIQGGTLILGGSNVSQLGTIEVFDTDNKIIFSADNKGVKCNKAIQMADGEIIWSEIDGYVFGTGFQTNTYYGPTSLKSIGANATGTDTRTFYMSYDGIESVWTGASSPFFKFRVTPSVAKGEGWTDISFSEGALFSGRLEVNKSITSFADKYDTKQPKLSKFIKGYTEDATNLSGTIKIKMPFSWTNTMLRVVIKGFDYSTKGVWEVIVGGYNYSTESRWVNGTFTTIGDPPFYTNVRLAHDGANCCILLGTTSTVWQMPKIWVEEVMAGYSRIDDWGTGWEITRITSETGITKIVNPTFIKFNSSVWADYANTLQVDANTSGVYKGNADGASFGGCNMDIRSWFGIGIVGLAGNPYGDGSRTMYINARNGDVNSRGWGCFGWGSGTRYVAIGNGNEINSWANGTSGLWLNYQGGTSGGVYVGNGSNSSTFGPIKASAFNNGSDISLKTNLVPIGDDTLNKLSSVQVYSFDFKDELESYSRAVEAYADKDDDSQTSEPMFPKRHIGVIAQDIEKVFPTIVSESVDSDGTVMPKTLDIYGLLSITIKALQELNKKVEEQQAEIEELKKYIK